MDSSAQQLLASMIRTQRVGALGTLYDGAPLVSMIAWVPAPDFASFIIHASRLAHHTQAILKNPRVSLMIAETDDGVRNPQGLARVSIHGEAAELPPTREFEEAGRLYLAKFPDAASLFGLGDFSLFRIRVDSARFVAGFGKTFNLTAEDFRRASQRGERAP